VNKHDESIYFCTRKNKIVISDRTIQSIKKFTLPGFDGVPIITVVKFFYKEIMKEGIVTRASSIAFFFILSVFPGLIFLFTLIPFIPIKNFQTNFLLTIKGIINNDGAYQIIRTTINDIVGIHHSGLLSIGFFLSIYSAMSGVKAMINAFNKGYEHTFKKRNFFQTNLVALKLTILLSIMLIAALVLIITQQNVFSWVFHHMHIKNSITKNVFAFFHFVIILSLLFFALSSLYYYGPAMKKKFRFISAGGTLATILFIIASWGFSYFVNHFASYNKLYGSIGSIIVIMLWIYFNSMVILVGFELNASIALSKSRMKTRYPDVQIHEWE
jgi:membrane protein